MKGYRKLRKVILIHLIPVAAWFEAYMNFDGGFESRSMHGCLSAVSVFCCPVLVEALQLADLRSKSPTKMSKHIHNFRS